jgi:pilus assembly protein Flp/PilA
LLTFSSHVPGYKWVIEIGSWRIQMFKFISKFRTNEEGATAIEYGLIAALVAIALIAALGNLGTALDTKFGEIETAVDEAGDPAP